MAFKQYRVASVSSNLNSFGLAGMILVARDGEAWSVGANSLNRLPKGADLTADMTTLRNRQGMSLGFELPQQLPSAPIEVIRELYPNDEE